MAITELSHCLARDYPTINWDRHPSMPDLWLEFDDRQRAGEDASDLLKKVKYRLKLSSRWPIVDCLPMVPGVAVSSRARAALEGLNVPGMRFLEFSVNSEPYFQFYTDRRIDCLDRERSKIKFFPSEPDQVMRVVRYAFFEDRIEERDVFTVPELSDGMFFWSQHTFFTDEARLQIERAGLIGFQFDELPA